MSLRPPTQGIATLEIMGTLDRLDLAAIPEGSADYYHVLVEAVKTAFIDRNRYVADPDFVDVPIETLLSDAYNDERRKLITDRASFELRPGHIEGYETQVERTLEALRNLSTTNREVTGGEPTLQSMRSARRGDTVHIDVVDRFGNMIAAMPSGGWLQSSPVIPELGFMLNSRALVLATVHRLVPRWKG